MKKVICSLMLSLAFIFFSNSSYAFAATNEQWNTVATMQESHFNGQSVTLDGKIYILGGFIYNVGVSSTVEEYDPVTKSHSSKASMLTGRSYFNAEVVDGKIYVTGGHIAHDTTNTTEMYDPVLNKWTSKASKTCRTEEAKSVVLDGKIYILGGHFKDENISAVECYDPATDTWTTKASMPLALYKFGIAVYNGKIYVIGGRTKYNTSSASDLTSAVEAYDPTTNSWTAKAALSSPKYDLHTAVIDNNIYTYDGSIINLYDPIKDIWVRKASSSNGRWCYNTAVSNNKIYILGGYAGGSQNLMTTDEVYDCNSNSFSLIPSLIQGRIGLLTASINGSIFAIGGNKIPEEAVKTIESYKTLDEPSLTVTASSNKVKVNQKFTTTVAIHNGTNICAEDVKITYNPDLFEYDGVQSKTGQKVYKEDKTTSGTVRLIVACQGKDNAATGDKDLLDLIFKAKKAGTGKVDIVKGRIADNATLEEDLLDDDCGEDTIEVEEAEDVNRSGEYTLLDLGIDAWYDGMDASDVDSAKYHADIVADGKIDDNDLTEITNQILANSNYIPNQY